MLRTRLLGSAVERVSARATSKVLVVFHPFAFVVVTWLGSHWLTGE